MSGVFADRGSGRRRFHGDHQADQDNHVDHTDHAHDAGPRQPDDPERRARDLVYRLLTTRARSRSELTQVLLRNGIDEDIVVPVLQKFLDAGLIDDAAFAESWVQERHRHQGLGREALGHELRRKGVDAEVIAEALSTVDGEAEVERAHELVRRRLRTMTAVDTTTRMRRLVGMLARKGYSEGLAFRVVRKELEQSEWATAEDDVAHPD